MIRTGSRIHWIAHAAVTQPERVYTVTERQCAVGCQPDLAPFQVVGSVTQRHLQKRVNEGRVSKVSGASQWIYNALAGMMWTLAEGGEQVPVIWAACRGRANAHSPKTMF